VLPASLLAFREKDQQRGAAQTHRRKFQEFQQLSGNRTFCTFQGSGTRLAEEVHSYVAGDTFKDDDATYMRKR
jgi:hypothetical protein